MEPANPMKELRRLAQVGYASILLFFSSMVLLAVLFASLKGPVTSLAVEWMLVAAISCALLVLATIYVDPTKGKDRPYCAPLELLIHSLGWGLFISAELIEVSPIGIGL